MTNVLRFDRFVLDLSRGCLRCGVQDISLRPKTFCILRYLAENAGRLVPKQELIDAAWPGAVVSDDSLVQCVRELRGALGSDGHRLIKTVPRRGYLMDATVACSVTPAPFGHVGGHALNRRLSQVAVLPFLSLGGGHSGEDIIDGITNDVTSYLSAYWTVIGLGTAFTYKGRPIDVTQLGRQLNVRYVAEGAVAGVGDKARITARLVDATSAATLCSDVLDVHWSDLRQTPDDVTARLAYFLQTGIHRSQGERSVRERRDIPEAAGLHWRGMELLFSTPKGRDISEPRRLFREALQRDRSLTHAWCGLSLTCLRDIRFSTTREQDLMDARAAAEQAMLLDPSVAPPHFATGWVLYEQGQPGDALVVLEHAAVLAPYDAGVHSMIANANIALGRPEKALEPLRKAMRINPSDPQLARSQANMGIACLHLQRDEEAVDWLSRSIALNPSDPFPLVFRASALALTRREREAKAELGRLLCLQPGFTLTRFKSREVSDVPAFRDQRERIFGALYQIGAPA